VEKDIVVIGGYFSEASGMDNDVAFLVRDPITLVSSLKKVYID
jgi:hypothetical protein